MKQNNIINLNFILIGVLYILISTVSMFHLVEFFELGNTKTFAWMLSIGFEIGSAVCLTALAFVNRIKVNLIIFAFVIITIMQIMGNVFYSYAHLNQSAIGNWFEVFWLSESGLPMIAQKRILSWFMGLPLIIVAALFIKSLVNYLQNPLSTKETENSGVETSEHVISNEESQNVPNTTHNVSELNSEKMDDENKKVEAQDTEKPGEKKQITADVQDNTNVVSPEYIPNSDVVSNDEISDDGVEETIDESEKSEIESNEQSDVHTEQDVQEELSKQETLGASSKDDRKIKRFIRKNIEGDEQKKKVWERYKRDGVIPNDINDVVNTFVRTAKGDDNPNDNKKKHLRQ